MPEKINLEQIWDKMKQTDNIVVRTTPKAELIKDLNGSFFYCKCKAGDLKEVFAQ